MDPATTSLQFYWYEINPDEQAGVRWAQVVGAMHRLQFVHDELTENTTEPEIERILERLVYNAENYLVRVYELRERIVTLVSTLSGASSRKAHQKVAGDLKSAGK